MSIDTQISSEEKTVDTLQTPPAQITVSQILNDLETGNDRKAIKSKYGLNTDELKMVFSHPALKNARVKKVKLMRFTLVDDTVDTAPTSIPMETPSLEETAEMLWGVDNTNVEATSEQQTRVEEGLDHKGEESGSDFDIDNIKTFAAKDYNTFTNPTEIQD